MRSNEASTNLTGCKSMHSGSGKGNPINCFALVTYITEPLGSFLDVLRRELVPGCLPRAHVTILPPRTLSVPTPIVVEELNSEIAELAPFEVQLKDVKCFEKTSVIYIDLGAGRAELQKIHDRLNQGALEFAEPFPYEPHITLAQELKPEQVEAVFEEARRQWAGFGFARSFPAETITFVQNTDSNSWVDLAHWTLGAVPSVR
jgi:2'-5' RNA ligase